MSGEVFRAAILGVVQGITEFLPVSSSGHLVIFPALLGWPQPSLTFDTVLHGGTAVAVLWYYRRDWLAMLRRAAGNVLHPMRDRTAEVRLLFLLAVGTVPAVVAGIALKDQFELLFASPRAAAAMLIVTGIVLAIADALCRRRSGLRPLDLRIALSVGVAQAVAIVPGLSRSGMTMAAGLLGGLSREEAARFSFLLAGPITAGVFVFQLADAWRLGEAPWEPPVALVAGFAAALLSGYLAIDWLLSYVRRSSFRAFAVYCWIAGAVSLWLLR